MSYVLAWKTRSNVYIAADSAITSAPISIDAYSSFGERQICDGNVSVSERAMKIVVNDDRPSIVIGRSIIARRFRLG